MKIVNHVIVTIFTAITATSSTVHASSKQPSREELINAATEAVLYLYPLVVFHTIEDISTNVAAPRVADERLYAPVNQLVSSTRFFSTQFKEAGHITNDMALTTGYIDTSKMAMVLSVPEVANRFFLIEFIDEWMNVQSAGTKTGAQRAYNYIILGPNFQGEIPVVPSMKLIRAQTNTLWLRLYIQIKDKKDVAAVRTLQSKIKLVPFAFFDRVYTPPSGKVDYSIDMKTSPISQVINSTAKKFFNAATAQFNKINIPTVDTQIVDTLALVGIKQGKAFDFDSLYVGSRDVLNEGLKQAIKKNSWIKIIKPHQWLEPFTAQYR